MAAAKKQSNRRGTAKTTSGRKKYEKKTDQKTGEKARSYQRIPDRDHFADNSGGFDHIDHQ